MGGGNGAKAAQKRERAAKGGAGKAGAKSQLKVNEAAKDIQCKVCFSTFLKTSREKALEEHAKNKHDKDLAFCFPNFVTAA